MGNYGIAYRDESDKGFTALEPWIIFFDIKATIEEVKKEYIRLVQSGCNNVTVFQYDEEYEEEPEGYFGWNFISPRKIKV